MGIFFPSDTDARPKIDKTSGGFVACVLIPNYKTCLPKFNFLHILRRPRTARSSLINQGISNRPSPLWRHDVARSTKALNYINYQKTNI